jgi:septal ring factor EnvC (AmiA/AmiB activator)
MTAMKIKWLLAGFLASFLGFSLAFADPAVAPKPDDPAALRKELDHTQLQLEQTRARVTKLEQQVRALQQANAALQRQVRAMEQPHLTPLSPE